MLPFLKHSKEASVSAPVEVERREPDEEKEFDSLESAAQDLIDAVHSKNAKGVADAFRAAFDIVENQPHEEYSHE